VFNGKEEIMHRPLTATIAVLLLAAAAGAIVTGAASAKDAGTTATISAPAACAAAGTTMTVVFSIATADGTPFGASGVFVRLRRGGGRPAVERPAAASAGAPGRYRARFRVPRGGLRRIDVGLRGTTTLADGTVRPAPVLFRTTGDPCRAPR
jgi:hypothetical protein